MYKNAKAYYNISNNVKLSLVKSKGKVMSNVNIYKAQMYETVDMQTVSIKSDGKEYLITKDYLQNIIKKIEGQILTLIEVMTDEGQSRKSAKSVMRQLLWSNIGKLRMLEAVKVSPGYKLVPNTEEAGKATRA